MESVRLKYLSSYLSLGLILSGVLLLTLEVRKTVTLIDGGELYTVTTSALTVGELLRTEGISLGEADLLQPSPYHWLGDGETIILERAAQIYLSVDEDIYILLTTERLPANILALADIPLYPGDLLYANGFSIAADTPLSPAPHHNLQVRRARAIHLHTGSQTHSILSAATTLGQALWEAGIQLYANDQLDPPAETPLFVAPPDIPWVVHLRSSQEIVIRSQEGQVRLRSAAATVGAALAEAGLSLQGLDYSLPPADRPLPPSGRVRIVRVQESVVIEQDPVSFETQYQPAPDLELDTQQVLQPGAYGLMARRVRVRLEDGVEVSRQVEAEYLAQEPQPRLVGYGTKVVIRTLNTPDGPIEYWRAVPMYATSYSPCRIFRDRCDSVTASGANLQKGIAAVTLKWYRFIGGTQVYVPDYGVATIADTGGGISGRLWIDLGYSDHDYVSWHKMTTVYLLTPVPANIMWILE